MLIKLSTLSSKWIDVIGKFLLKVVIGKLFEVPIKRKRNKNLIERAIKFPLCLLPSFLSANPLHLRWSKIYHSTSRYLWQNFYITRCVSDISCLVIMFSIFFEQIMHFNCSGANLVLNIVHNQSTNNYVFHIGT